MSTSPPPEVQGIPLHPPQCVVGVIGGGQLGRMMALAARRMGIRIAVWTGGLEAPAVELADEVIDAPFDDPQALERFCRSSTVATVEFENIPAATLAGAHWPGARAVVCALPPLCAGFPVASPLAFCITIRGSSVDPLSPHR